MPNWLESSGRSQSPEDGLRFLGEGLPHGGVALGALGPAEGADGPIAAGAAQGAGNQLDAAHASFLITTLLGVTGLWIAILADTGATVLVTINALRLLRAKL